MSRKCRAFTKCIDAVTIRTGGGVYFLSGGWHVWIWFRLVLGLYLGWHVQVLLALASTLGADWRY